VPDDRKDEAHTKFQSIAFAYAVLSDPARRKRYDETGSTSESIVDSEGFSWTDFYREQYRDSISDDAIKKFANKYKKSDEEKDDVLAAYQEFEGDMDGVYESVMLSDGHEDDARFRSIIDQAIDAGEVEAFNAYTKETAKSRKERLKRAAGEAAEAEEYAKELGIHDKLYGKKRKGKEDGEADLAALIRSRQEDRGTKFLDQLAEKYGASNGKKAGSKKRKQISSITTDEPDEEAFQAAAARLGKKDGGSGKASKKSKK
jgi:DnaJ homolog subfamily C member 9